MSMILGPEPRLWAIQLPLASMVTLSTYGDTKSRNRLVTCSSEPDGAAILRLWKSASFNALSIFNVQR